MESLIPTRSQDIGKERPLMGARPAVKARHGDESDYSDDWPADSR
jgi:hypothetical protein